MYHIEIIFLELIDKLTTLLEVYIYIYIIVVFHYKFC
jgi:hypothetical protein